MSLRAVAIYLFCMMLNGCVLGPDFSPPKSPKIQRYTEKPLPKRTVSIPGQSTQRFTQGNIPLRWWYLFRSPQLNQLVKVGLHNSPTLTGAQAVLRQAQENLQVQFSNSLIPSVDLQLGAQRQHASTSSNFPNDGSSNNGANTPSVFNLFNASVSVAYTFDFFGQARRAIEASGAVVDYQYYQLQAAHLALAANIVTTTVTAAALNSQISVTQQLISEQKQQLEIARKQMELGAISGLDVMNQLTLLAQTQATLPPLRKQYEQTRNALAIYLGEPPSQSCLPNLFLTDLHLPRNLPVSLPGRLVQQRPDVQAGLALLHQASAQIGVTTANLFPQITLTGNYGVLGTQLPNLFSIQNITWNLATQLTQPIFHGGALLAQRRAAIAAYDQACAAYREVVLQAIGQVANSLLALSRDAQTVREQNKAEISARSSLNLVQQQFHLGSVSYLEMLNAQRQYQQARIALIQAEALRYADTVALFQSLGGPWWPYDRISGKSCIL
jgi:NodT family efflux transporter outer membrane factor (OMF) lipoprotein